MGNFPILVINQFFEIKNKTTELGESSSFERNFNRLKSIFEEEGYIVHDPTNEIYTDSRTDCEASFVGKVMSKMTITKTLKPIIYKKSDGAVTLIQKAVVFVEAK